MIHTLIGVFNSPIGQIIQPDLSRKALTGLIEEVLGLTKWQLFRDNIAVAEKTETQKLLNESQQTLNNEAVTPVDEGMLNTEE